jgi:predicted amidohydrolase
LDSILFPSKQIYTYIARAIENQCYVIAAAQYGKHNAKRESYGHSLIIDPWGQILADAGGYDDDLHNNMGTTKKKEDNNNKDIIISGIRPNESTTTATVPNDDDEDTKKKTTPSVIMCEINLDSLESIRQRMPIQTHRQNAAFIE